jgi:hypothetical protein
MNAGYYERLLINIRPDGVYGCFEMSKVSLPDQDLI